MIKLSVKPVYSRKAKVVPIKNNTEGLEFREHQIETYEAINDPDVDVVFNTAMTGDGKSLAAYLPALVDNRRILAMYPTNELIRDQREQIRSYCNMFNRDITPECMFSEYLYKLRAELKIGSQANAIAFLTRHDILLTNPDIFNLIANFKYMSKHQNPDRLLQIVVDCYNIFLFDEFHIYDVSQVMSVLTAMLYIIEQTRKTRQRKKFVFLSATPSPLLLECLERANLRYKIIKGNYCFKNVNAQNWSQICQPFTLHFHGVGRQTEAWVQSHYQEIANWFSEHPGSRGAIIVDSVAAAKHIVTFLEERQDIGDFPSSISIGENTGMSTRKGKASSLESDLLVGTSTVDVGIDFKINYLAFEALDPGSWIQRLGRLGRHKGYKRGGKTVRFTNFEAHSLLPKYVAERVAGANISTPEIDKVSLIDLMRNDKNETRIFSPVNDFRIYQSTWGWLHPAHVINTLGHPRLRDNYTLLREQLTETYSNIFKVDISERVKWYYAITQKQPAVVEDAISRFRGESPFTCGILDETDGGIKPYNLLWVLKNAETEWISKQEFMRVVEARDVQSYRLGLTQ